MVSVCLHQPNFLPWTKLLAKIAASDVYLAYDTVQFTRTEFHNRQHVRSRTGTVLLTAPVRHAKRRQVISDVELDDSQDWRGLHLRILQQEYRRSPYFDEVFSFVCAIYARGHHLLVDHNLDLLGALCTYLGYDTTIVRASQFPHAGDNTERLIGLTLAVEANTHLTSTWGTDRRYIDWHRVQLAGITVRTQDFVHPIYQQHHAPPFIAGLGVIDLLFAEGKAAAETITSSTAFSTID